ncbi:MAG TPA: VUT family protein [Gaiellaceae bacterium]|nr:VUT family protein [Gaiellaceae bacterium]
MRLAVLTGLYVGVVVSAQVGTNKIVDVPFTDLTAPGGTFLIGIALSLIELAHRTAPTRREGFVNAQVMVLCGWAASILLAAYLAILNVMSPDDPLFDRLAGTWRIVLGSLVAFLASETIDNSFGAWLRDRVHDAVRVVATNAVSVPLDSIVFLLVAFGSLEFIEGQIVVKYAATLIVGVPLVVALRRYVRPR